MAAKQALVIGIDNYSRSPLNTCVHDAVEMTALLEMPEYGFSVKTLLNLDATRRAVMAELQEMLERPAEMYLFYFSGHGASMPTGSYLVTCEMDELDIGIEFEWLARVIRSIAPPSAQVIVLLDCCRSGGMPIPSRTGRSKVVQPPDFDNLANTLLSGQAVLAACQGIEDSFTDESAGYSVFTYHLLQGLQGEAADSSGKVTVQSLSSYVATSIGTTGGQVPVFKGDITGIFELGCGLEPRFAKPLPAERAERMEDEAERHVRDFQPYMAQMQDLRLWRTAGHKAACQRVLPIVTWFETKIAELPQLRLRPRFAGAWGTLQQRVAQLTHVEVGMVGEKGEFLAKVGAGNFGTVWKVGMAGRLLALKTYHPHDFLFPEKMKRFRRGYDAMKQLDHPNIVKVHEFSRCPLGFYMDFINGANLRDANYAFEEPLKIVQILLLIAETVRHAHLRSVIHRDIKPENIILMQEDERPIPYLTDFDLAWFSTATQVTKAEAFGTVHYSAPEQLANPMSHAAHSNSVDSYSFGQLVFFVVTGSDPIPFGVADNAGHLRKRLQSGWFHDAAQALAELYSQCVDLIPEHRPALDDVCGRLATILHLLTMFDRHTRLKPEEFVAELLFMLIGLPILNTCSENEMITLSGKTKVRITSRSPCGKNTTWRFNCHALQAPMLEGVDFHKMKQTLNSRIAACVRDIPGTTVRPGTQPPYEAVIECNDLPLSLEGLQRARLVISKVIDIIEGR